MGSKALRTRDKYRTRGPNSGIRVRVFAVSVWIPSRCFPSSPRSHLRGTSDNQYYIAERPKKSYLVMPPSELPITDLPVWAHLNNVRFGDFEVANFEGKGFSVVYRPRDESDESEESQSACITVPHSLVLNHAAVDEYSKEDQSFRQLLDAVGHRVGSSPVVPACTRHSLTRRSL